MIEEKEFHFIGYFMIEEKEFHFIDYYKISYISVY